MDARRALLAQLGAASTEPPFRLANPLAEDPALLVLALPLAAPAALPALVARVRPRDLETTPN